MLDDEVKLKSPLLKLSEQFSVGFSARLEQFVIGDEDDLLTSKLWLEIAGGPDHCSHFQ